MEDFENKVEELVKVVSMSYFTNEEDKRDYFSEVENPTEEGWEDECVKLAINEIRDYLDNLSMDY